MGSERNPEYKDVSNISNNHLPIRMPLCLDGFEEKSKVQRRLTHNKNQVPNIMQLCVDGFGEKSRVQRRLKHNKKTGTQHYAIMCRWVWGEIQTSRTSQIYKNTSTQNDAITRGWVWEEINLCFGDTDFVVRRNQISCFGETDLCFIEGWPSRNCLHRASQREPLQSQHLKHSSGSFNMFFTFVSAV